MRAKFNSKKSIPALAVALAAIAVGSAASPAAASPVAPAVKADGEYSPSTWVEGGGFGVSGETTSITSDAAERIRRGDRRVALVLQAADHVVPTGGLGERAMYEDYGGLGSILRVFAHAFLLDRGVRSRAIAPRPAV